MRYFELCEKSSLFAKEIIDSSEFVELLRLKEEISNNIPDLLENFKKAKEMYEQVSQYSTYHPDYKKVKMELVKAKEVLYTNPLVIEYKRYERLIQEKMVKASKEILNAISNNIK